MDISNRDTQSVPAIRRQFQQRPQPAPYVVQLPAHTTAKEVKRKGLHHWLRYQRRSWYFTLAFVLFIVLAEIAGLTLSLALTNYLPGQSQLFPQTFPVITPTVANCIHETVYFNATGQKTQIGIDEVCK